MILPETGFVQVSSGLHSSMDRVRASEARDVGSIPTGGILTFDTLDQIQLVLYLSLI